MLRSKIQGARNIDYIYSVRYREHQILRNFTQQDTGCAKYKAKALQLDTVCTKYKTITTQRDTGCAKYRLNATQQDTGCAKSRF